jgi:hypothetical protein
MTIFHARPRIALLGCTVLMCFIAAATNPANAGRGGLFSALFSASKAAAPVVRNTGRAAEDAALTARGAAKAERGAGHSVGETAKTGLDIAKSAADLATGGSSSTGGQSPSGKPVLSRAALETCVREAHSLDDLNDSHQSDKAKVENDRREIQKLNAKIDEARDDVDTSSRRSVNAFNAKLAAAKTRLADFNATIDRLNTQAAAFNTRVDSFNASCNGKAYFQDDLLAVELMIGIKLAN